MNSHGNTRFHHLLAVLAALCISCRHAGDALPKQPRKEMVGATVHSAAGRTEPRRDWGVAYYMPYDNSLASLGPRIIDRIERGTRSRNIVSAVQADFVGKGGMCRHAILAEGTHRIPVPSERSADPEQAIAYLRWFVETFPCRKYAFIFLGHGGKVDQMCSDLHPGPGGEHWMSGNMLGRKLREFRNSTHARVELVFLQQCGRGSVENLYSFRKTANFVMSSPINVGAPNTYRTRLNGWLAAHPDATGDGIARKIAAEDRDFAVYTCARGDRLAELAPRLDQAIKPLLDGKELSPPTLPPVIYSSGRERAVDFRALLHSLAKANSGETARIAQLHEWVGKELLTSVNFNPRQRDLSATHCGLSVFVPSQAADLDRYAQLDLYRETDLPALWKRLMAPEKNAAKTR
ncbi:MAG: hypothetical protein HN742_38370 [Lentisphaerae bacterium]|jgi:hypothetical protein|nr:hypothetical protein [Lentisphaerota bacterium]MBT4815800.1 hypothetical protein [Lentisphaerota bacterium]MBT5609296.1 hypothetical protein [Lentisphaerota bacterium]MBT7059410.1 hypothetical protein [Lentisphaerota bacterium]MBT7847794.1 hypothetical protein [Lentisphaerota bacterium]